MPTFAELLATPDADIEAIAAHLDALSDERRIEETRAVGPEAQRRLWRLARGRLTSLSDFVPSDRAPLEPVRHFGRNTLPAFRMFEKRFCRPGPGYDADVLWGYNEGTTRKLVGPGYFVLRTTDGDARGETVVDYYQVPPSKPDGWPRVIPNTVGPQRLVYAFMHDFMRKVSDHVTIGRAYKNDRETPNCFLLCRER